MVRKFKINDRNLTLIFGILNAKISLLAALILVSSLFGTVSANEISAYEEQELLLSELSQNSYLEIDERVIATVQLGQYHGANAMIAISRASRSKSAALRIASIQAAKRWQANAKWDLVSPLLSDNEQQVKSQAVRALVTFMPQLPKAEQTILQNSINEHLQSLPTSLKSDLEKAWFYSAQENFTKAETKYKIMMNESLDIRIIVGYVELLKQQNKDRQAISLIKTNINKYSDNAPLHYSLGLTYHRLGDFKNSKDHLALANNLAPQNPTYGFAYAIALQGNEPEKAIELLQMVYQQMPQTNYLYALCDALLNEGRNAQVCLSELTKKVPDDVVKQLNNQYQSTINNAKNNLG